MSVYTIRHIEAHLPQIDGEVYYEEDLPSTEKDGAVYSCYKNGTKYFKFNATADKWEEIEKPERKWELLKPLTIQRRKKCRPYYKVNLLEEWKDKKKFKELYEKSGVKIPDEAPEDKVVIRYYESEDTDEFNHYDKDGNVIYMKQHPEWSNNGGAIRDDYISTRGWGPDVPFQGRGIPDDINPETYQDLLGKDGKLRGYDHTWVMLSEWCQLLETEEKRILGMINEAYERKNRTEINKKLDFIINHMKDPLSADRTELDKKEVDSEGNPIEDDYYDSPEYIIEEYMSNLYNIEAEIARTAAIADMYQLWGSDNIRIIYYLEH